LQLLSALAWWRAAGHDTVTRAQLAAVAGWKVTSGHLRNVAGSLRTAALIDYPGAGTISLTEAGRAAAPPPDDTDLRSRIEDVLTNPQRQVFDVLTERREEMSRTDLAVAVGWEPSSGHVRNILGSLRTLDVITYPRQGYVALTDWVAEGLGQ
jgi:Mn-dependent DtxR family transcriptional regulator